MTFPNGYRGVKKVFTAEILNLIASVLIIAAGVAALIAIPAMLSAQVDASLVSLGGAGVFSIISVILVIIAFIMRLVGLNQAGKDNDKFRTAFLVIIFALIMAVVAGILNAIFGVNSIADDIVTLLSRICNIIAIFMVIGGIQDFAEELGNEKLFNRGNTISWIIVIPYALAAIANLIPGFFGVNATTSTVAGVMQIVGGILGVVGSILYLIYLGQGKKMLKNN